MDIMQKLHQLLETALKSDSRPDYSSDLMVSKTNAEVKRAVDDVVKHLKSKGFITDRGLQSAMYAIRVFGPDRKSVV